MSDSKPLWLQIVEALFGALAGGLTKKNLAAAGAGPDAMSGAVTGMVDLPTFAAGEEQPPAGVYESRDEAHLHPELRRRYRLVCEEYHARCGRRLFPTRTWSSPQAQFDHFKKGRHLNGAGEWVVDDPVTRAGVVTNLDGFKRRSYHNYWPSRAVDSAVDEDPGPGKHVSWNPEHYDLLGELADKHGLIWGGRFRGFGKHGDYPHLELPPEAA